MFKTKQKLNDSDTPAMIFLCTYSRLIQHLYNRQIIVYYNVKTCCPGYKGKDCDTRKYSSLPAKINTDSHVSSI